MKSSASHPASSTPLETAHAHGVIHRDIKPSNILLDRAGEARLGDFGSSYFKEGGTPQKTAADDDDGRRLVGTLAYMPEQVRGSSVDLRADLYAVGLVMYVMIARRLAIDLEGCPIYEAVARVGSPTLGLAAVLTRWRELLAKALRSERDLRYASASEMRRALHDSTQVSGERREASRMTHTVAIQSGLNIEKQGRFDRS